MAIIGKTLSHRNINTIAIYARLYIDPVRDAMNKATQAIWSAGNRPQEAQNLIEIKNAKLVK